MNRPLRLLIFALDPGGHRVSLHLRNIVGEAIRRSWILHVVTTDYTLGHPAYSLLNREYGDQFTVSTMPAVEFPASAPSLPNLVRYQVQQFSRLTKAYRKVRRTFSPDAIYVNDLNYCDKIIGVMGSPFGEVPVLGMLLGPKFHHRTMGVIVPVNRYDWLHEKLFTFLLSARALSSVLVIDPLLKPFMSNKAHKNYKKIILISDAAQLSGNSTRVGARRALGLDEHQVVVLVYGALDLRKGIKSVVAALRNFGGASNVITIFAGEPQDSPTRQFLAEREVVDLTERKLLRIIPEFLDDEREFALFAAADIVWLGYQNFYGMSGVLFQAGAASLPVIACKEGLIGWLARKHELGEVLNSADPADISASICRLAGNPQARRISGEHGRRLAAAHTPDKLAIGVCDAVVRAVDHTHKQSLTTYISQ